MIKQVTYEEAMSRFKHLYRQEKLPHDKVQNAVWFISDYSCGALLWVDKQHRRARLKGAVTLPEERGQGHGEAMLKHRIQYAYDHGAKEIEVLARHPNWFLRNGFEIIRITKWGVTVLRHAGLKSMQNG